ncbi:Hypothetical protein arginine N-methyltransferase 10, partial [Stegodyphus mimosarum]
MCYEQALEVLPHDSHVLHGLATVLFRLGFVECALSYFLKSYQANPFFTPSLYCMENLKNALVERWHFVMLNDIERNTAYERAIRKAVKEGHNCVLDIGAGTGILSMMAYDAGAKKVYACEASEIMFTVLQNVIKENDKPIQAFQKFSNELCVPEDLPERVNLVVTEIFDAGLFGEHSLETLNHAWEHLLLDNHSNICPVSNANDLSPNSSVSCADVNDLNNENIQDLNNSEITKGMIIPQSATVFALPIECERFRKFFRLDSKILEALDINNLVLPQFLDEEPYSTEKIMNIPGGYKALSNPLVLLEVNFNSRQDIKSLLEGKLLNLTYQCMNSGSLDAFVVWFDLHLDSETSISSAPKGNSPDSCCWDQAIFYVLPQYLEGCSSVCTKGDSIEVQFHCKGHLRLHYVKIKDNSEKSVPSQKISMDPSLIYLLNSYVTGNIIDINLQDISSMDNSTVLDVSTFPALSLKSLRGSSTSVTVLKTQYQTEIEQLQELYKVPQDRLLFKSYEDFYKTSNMLYDFLIIDPVELCGLLKKNLLEDITMLKMKCLKETGVVIPGEIEISAMLIGSPILKEQSKVVCDDRTAGYKISQIMNAYRCRIHQDIEFSTLQHQKLSEPVKLCQVNLNDKSATDRKTFFNTMHNTIEIELINSGQATAIIYWFTLKYGSNFWVDTSDPLGLWKQAACVLDDEVHVSKGEKICLEWSLKNGCFQIGILDHASSV